MQSPLARRALEADADIGALLRGNVVIRAGRSGGPEVLSAEPVRDLSGAPGIRDLAADAR